MTASKCIQDVSFSECESSHVGKLHLQINCNSDCIYVLRSMVAVMTTRACMEARQSNRVSIAVDELFANISKHAYGGKAGRVELETFLEVDAHGEQELVFDFRDYASVGWQGSMEEAAERSIDVENLCPGGLGLKLICSAADHCEHEVLSDGNHWRLKFCINNKSL